MKKTSILAGAIAAIVLAAGAAVPAQAFSGSRTVTLPGTSIKLQANAWSPNILSGGRIDFATSSKTTLNGKSKNVEQIRNTATIEARGINPSVSLPKGVGGSGTASSKSIAWTNKNSWISDLSGTASYSGLTISVHVNSSAFALHQGVKKYVDVWSW
ncbi:hypothetical protein [Homoserinibacter sp. GY 40078]|uniref:hypothetical protein n=1 Tax=Homoserinibacter sp. GY 40078 TaxID=2603275 RepID=UPI0011CB7F1A|nr:hypothetical protein [Homoserinibacter sp. GY 40078]TXK18817.1 hypothetical protein FVQ89_02425 [Homoserinibacter sp. GY 40078]